MKTVLTLSLSAMMLFGLVFASIPDAFADPGHEVTFSKSSTTTGGTNNMLITVDDNLGDEVIGTATWLGYNPGLGASIGNHPFCTNPANFNGLDLNSQVWGLFDQSGAGQQPRVHFPGTGTHTVGFTFGNGNPVELVGFAGTPVPFDGGTVGVVHQWPNPFVNDVIADTVDLPLHWVSVANLPGTLPLSTGGLADLIGPTQLGNWFGQSCGFADILHNAVFDTPADMDNMDIDDNPGGILETFQVLQPVGGEILSIDTTALLIAGASANALWILPALALAAGAAFTVLKLQVSRKNL